MSRYITSIGIRERLPRSPQRPVCVSVLVYRKGAYAVTHTKQVVRAGDGATLCRYTAPEKIAEGRRLALRRLAYLRRRKEEVVKSSFSRRIEGASRPSPALTVDIGIERRKERW